MAAARYDFEFKDVLQALVKEAGIEEGIWQLGVEFGFAASNVASEDNVDNLKPAAMIAVNRFYSHERRELRVLPSTLRAWTAAKLW